MKHWKVVLTVSDDGISDHDTEDYYTDEFLKKELEHHANFVTGIEVKVTSIEEIPRDKRKT